MVIKIEKSNNRLGPEAVEAFEMAIGKKLPHDYREFLLSFNGGKPEANEFPIAGQKNAAAVDLFYGVLKQREWGDLFYHRNALISRVPENVLPIGDASFGNVICLSLQPSTFGGVFFWDHELEADEGEPATFSNLFKIGNSFTDFFEKIKQFNSSQVQLKPGQVKKAWINPEFLKEQRQKGNTTE